MEYRELFLALFRKFDERYHPRSFLRDLVETTHLFLKMLERFCRSRGNLMVQVRGSPGCEKSCGGGGIEACGIASMELPVRFMFHLSQKGSWRVQ